MKKLILAAGAFLFMLPVLKADIVIPGHGTITSNTPDGVRFFCKGSHGDCIRISGPTCIVNFEDGHQEAYQIDGYEILSSTEAGTEVVIYRH